jgi:hypothetical protein
MWPTGNDMAPPASASGAISLGSYPKASVACAETSPERIPEISVAETITIISVFFGVIMTSHPVHPKAPAITNAVQNRASVTNEGQRIRTFERPSTPLIGIDQI